MLIQQIFYLFKKGIFFFATIKLSGLKQKVKPSNLRK